MFPVNIANTFLTEQLRGQKKQYSWFRKCGWQKNLHLGGRKKNFFINLIQFFKQSLHLKNHSNNTFFLLTNKEPYPLLFEAKKRKFVLINLLAGPYLGWITFGKRVSAQIGTCIFFKIRK